MARRRSGPRPENPREAERRARIARAPSNNWLEEEREHHLMFADKPKAQLILMTDSTQEKRAAPQRPFKFRDMRPKGAKGGGAW